MSAQAGIPEGFEPVPVTAIPGDWEPLGGIPNYDDMVRAEALRQGFTPEKAELAVSLHRQEYNPSQFVSSAGAIGPMQLMPDTAKGEGVDPWDIAGNIRGGVSYFKKQLNKFGSPELALAAYNAGPEAVRQHGGVPPYAQTRKHVRMSMDRWKRLLAKGKPSQGIPDGFEPLDIPDGFEPLDESEISQQANGIPQGWEEQPSVFSDEMVPLSIDNPNAPPYQEPKGTWLSPANEEKFQKWYGDWAIREGMNPNPDDPAHKYDYRAAFLAGVTPPGEPGGHWPSKFKADDHPNRFIPLLSGKVWDTKKDEIVPAIRETPETQYVQSRIAGIEAFDALQNQPSDWEPIHDYTGMQTVDLGKKPPSDYRMPTLKEFSQQLLDAPLDTYASFAKELNLSMESFSKKLSKISGLLEGEQLTDSRKKILEEMGLRKPDSKDEGTLNLDKILQEAGAKGKEYFRELAGEYRDNAKWWDDKIKNRDLATETITAAAGGAVPGIVEFTLGPVFSALEGYSEGGLTDAGKKALERVLMGKVLEASHPLARPYRASVMAAIGGAQAAEGGGEFRDIVKGAGSMGILGAMGGPGQVGLREALQNFTRTSVLPLFERGELTYEDALSQVKKAMVKDFPEFQAKPDVLNRVAEWLIEGEDFTPETVRRAEESTKAKPEEQPQTPPVSERPEEASVEAMKIPPSSDESLKITELHDYTVDNPGGAKKSVSIGKVEDAEAAKLKDNTGIDGLEGYTHTIDSFSVRHILKTHGQSSTEVSRGQAPITRQDLEKIPEIIQSPDKIENAGKSPLGLDTIKYTKSFNGDVYYLEEVRTGRKELAAKTMWKSGKTGAPRATSEEGVAHTSETFPGNEGKLSPVSESVKTDPKADPDEPLFSKVNQSGTLARIDVPPVPAVQDIKVKPLPNEATRAGMIKEIERSLNLPIRIGRFRQQAEGIFKPREGVVRLRRANDIEVAAHEAGHKIHMHELMIGLPKEMPDEVRSMAYEGAKDLDKEGFAEFFRVYVTQPDIAFERAPTFYEKFEGLLDQNHEISELVTRTRQAFQQYAAAPSVVKVMSFIRQTPPEQRRDWPQTMNDVYKNMVDELRPLQVLKQIAEERGGRPIPISEDPYYLAWLTRGWARKAEQFLKYGQFRITEDGVETTGPSLRDILRPHELKGERELLDTYLVAKRAVNDPRILEGFKDILPKGDLEQTANELEARFSETAAKLYQYSDNLFRHLVDSGRISEEAYQAIKERNLFYAPFYRFIEDDPSVGGLSKRKFGNLSDPIKTLRGSSRDIWSPTQNIMKNTYAFLNIAERAKIGEALIKMAKIKGMGEFIEKLPVEMKPAAKIGQEELEAALQKYGTYKETRTFKETQRTIGKKISAYGAAEQPSAKMEKVALEALTSRGWTSAEANQILQRIKSAETEDAKQKVIETTIEKSTLMTIVREFGFDLRGAELTVWRPNYNPKPNEVVLFNRGKPAVYELSPQLYKSLMGLDGESIDSLTKILGYPSKILRAGATLTPEFILRNPMRDQLTAFVYSKYGFVPGYDVIKGLYHILGKTDVYRDFNASGAAHAALVSLDRDYLSQNLQELLASRKKQISNLITHPLRGLQALSELTEEATRVGAFARALSKEGTNPEALMKAAIESRDLTLDFARIGAKTKSWNAITAFWNAQVQGLDKAARSFKERPLQTFSRVFMGITLPSILLQWAQADDPYYQEIPTWRRALFWNIVTHNEDGSLRHIWSIPKPFEVGILFGTFPEMALDYLHKNTKSTLAAEEAGSAFLKALMPGFMPTFLTPMVEWWAGRNWFFDRPTVPRDKEELKPYLQYTPWTHESLKLLARGMDKIPLLREAASPTKMENTIRSVAGGTGAAALSVVDEMLKATGLINVPTAPSMVLEDLPGIRGFMQRFPTGNTRSIEEFYKQYQEIKRGYESAKEELGVRGLGDFGVKTKTPEYIAQMEGTAKALSVYRKLAEMTMANRTMPAEEKRQNLNQIYLQMINTARQALGKGRI